MKKKNITTKDLVAQLALGVKIFIACTENGIIPAKHSPCHKKMKELYRVYNKRRKHEQIKRI